MSETRLVIKWEQDPAQPEPILVKHLDVLQAVTCGDAAEQRQACPTSEMCCETPGSAQE